MSTLQVINLHFESTGNNRIQYLSNNTLNIVAGGITAVTSNSSVVTIGSQNNIIANSSATAVGVGNNIFVNSTATMIKYGATGSDYRSVVDLTTIANTSYTIQTSDAGKMLETTSSSATTILIPNNSIAPLSIGTRVDLYQYGTGQLSVAPDTGVTLRSVVSRRKITAQYAGASLYKRGTNEWVLIGDITV